MRILRMAGSCPNFSRILAHKLSTYLLRFDYSFLFTYPSADDMLS
jgi:hypothetical protein